MNGRRSAIAVAVCLWVAFPCARTVGAGDDVGALLRAMPADFPVVVVVPDMAGFDKTVSAVKRRFDPSEGDDGIVSQIKRETGIAEWADFGKPMGFGIPAFGGAKWQGVVWLSVADFAKRAKAVPGASEADGVWELPFEGKDTLFVCVRGDFVAVTNRREVLTRVRKEGPSLADGAKVGMNLLRGREAWIHVNVDPVRPSALAGVAQAAQMAPMLAMLASQQGGADPAMLTGLFGGAMDGVKGFVEQIASVDVVISLSETAADVTVATAYEEGPIKTYLAKQKPAKVPLLGQLEEQPYVLAWAHHVPGRESPFLDYWVDQMASAIQSAPTGGGAEGEAAGRASALKEAVETARELFRRVEGQNFVMHVSSGKLGVVCDYMSEDPKGLVELVKKSLTMSNPLMTQLYAGARYEALGSKTVAGVSVEEFSLKVDTTNPAAASLLALYGGNPRFVIGIAGDRVRYCMSSDPRLERVFAAKVGKPFTSNRYVSEALAALPARRNMILLVDPAAVLPVIGPMIGKPTAAPIPPGAPIALAVCLAGEPARVDIHVPFRASERLMQATGRDEPM